MQTKKKKKAKPQATIPGLPTDEMVVIVSFLNGPEQIGIQLACKTFYDSIVPKAMWIGGIYGAVGELNLLHKFIKAPTLIKAQLLMRSFLQYYKDSTA